MDALVKKEHCSYQKDDSKLLNLIFDYNNSSSYENKYNYKYQELFHYRVS